ncbi:MAG: MFS transporter [Phycisphaerales bacterium]
MHRDQISALLDLRSLVSLQKPAQLSTEPPLKPESGFYFGWLMLPVATLMTICTLPGQTVVVSQFNTAFRTDLGLTKQSLSLAYLIGTLTASLPLTYVGKVSDNLGPRITTAIVVAGFTLACITVASAHNIAALTLGFFMIRFLGQGALGMLGSHLLALWFERRLATVESIKHAGMSLAGAASPLVVVWLISATTWRSTYIILGTTVAVLILPLVATVFRNKPEDIGQHLDNEPPEYHERWHDIHEAKAAPVSEIAFTLKQARSTLAFWCVSLPGILSGLIGTAMLFHIQPILEGAGVDDFVSAGALSATWWSIVLFISIVVSGPIADRVHPRILLPISVLGTALSIVIMALAQSEIAVISSMAVFGAAQGVAISTSGPTIARYFGRTHHGSIRGFMTTLMVAGTALGPYLIALGEQISGGSFRPPLLAAAAAAVLIAALSAKTTKPPAPQE